jgi:hypothetical protein
MMITIKVRIYETNARTAARTSNYLDEKRTVLKLNIDSESRKQNERKYHHIFPLTFIYSSVDASESKLLFTASITMYLCKQYTKTISIHGSKCRIEVSMFIEVNFDRKTCYRSYNFDKHTNFDTTYTYSNFAVVISYFVVLSLIRCFYFRRYSLWLVSTLMILLFI